MCCQLLPTAAALPSFKHIRRLEVVRITSISRTDVALKAALAEAERRERAEQELREQQLQLQLLEQTLNGTNLPPNIHIHTHAHTHNSSTCTPPHHPNTVQLRPSPRQPNKRLYKNIRATPHAHRE